MKAPELKLVKSMAEPALARPKSSATERRPDGAMPSYTLILGLREGDPHAVSAVYWEHHRALRALGRHLLGNAADAEDLLHDVFLALPRALKSYRGDCSLRTFLCSIAMKRAGKMHRGFGRYRRFLSFLSNRELFGPGEAPPELALERSELSARLAEELRRLPFAQRAAVVLCLVEERSAGEAAEILGIPEATVRTRLFHARRRLRERLEGSR